MERIQSAIAKARAERQGRQAPGPVKANPAADLSPHPPPSAAVSGPVSGPISGPAPDAAAITARWAALTPFTPDPRQLTAWRILTAAGGREAVPFDVMRTRLLQQMRQNNWRRIAVTSPTAACGKTTVALNLAFSLARQPELRTILCELDLRRPSISAMLGLTGDLAMIRLLEGSAVAAEARRIGRNLAVLPNRHSVRNAAELLQGPEMTAALARIEAEYAPDVMLFDLPPMQVSDDTMAFAGKVDAVLLVAAAEATTVKQIDTCERDLATQTNVMGVVLNKCRYIGPEQGYDNY